MTKPEFQDLQKRATVSGMTLKSFLQDEGVAYSTYNNWCRKMKAETETQPMAPISILRDGYSGEAHPAIPAITTHFFHAWRPHFAMSVQS